jgi:hypothetical protein
MLAFWVFMRNAAPVIGGAIIFGLNAKLDSSGGVSLRTYLTIIGIMCAGPFIALLLSPPEKVQRRDGVKIAFRQQELGRTLSEFYRVITSRDVSPFALLCWNLAFKLCQDSPLVPLVLHLVVLWVLHWYTSDFSSIVNISHQ